MVVLIIAQAKAHNIYIAQFYVDVFAYLCLNFDVDSYMAVKEAPCSQRFNQLTTLDSLCYYPCAQQSMLALAGRTVHPEAGRVCMTLFYTGSAARVHYWPFVRGIRWLPVVNFIITMMTSSNGSFFRVTCSLWGESTGDAELWCFLWSAHE